MLDVSAWKESPLKSLFTAALIATALITSGTLSACAPSFRGIRAEEIQSAGMKFEFAHDRAATFDAFRKAADDLGFSVDHADRDTGVITGTTGMSLVSYGERFAINVASDGANSSRVFIISELLMKTNVFADAGNVRRMIVNQAAMNLEKR